MGDLLRESSDWLEEMRTRYLAKPVRYVRGSQSVELLASVGKTVFRVDNGYGISERFESRDYLMLAGGLMLAGIQIEPQAGDQIVETEGGRTWTYEVMAPGNEPCWRYSDSYRKALRIHTKLTANEGE